ncbi:hypothetical protein RCL1_009074 [Eukaryota sp. TZLM3-RCL]
MSSSPSPDIPFQRAQYATLGSSYIHKNGSGIYQAAADGKLIFHYQPGYVVSDLELSPGSSLWCRIPKHFLNHSNTNVVTRQLWGTDRYTDDSDLVAVLAHMGKFKLSKALPCDLLAIDVKVKIIGPFSEYIGSEKNGILSRSRSDIGEIIGMEVVFVRKLERDIPDIVFLDTPTVMFNLSGEPVCKYELGYFRDLSFLRISERFLKNVLYFENHSQRFELSFYPSPSFGVQPNHPYFAQGKLVLSRVLQPHTWTRKRLGEAAKASRLPIGLHYSEEVEKLVELSWDDIYFGDACISCKDLVLNIVKYFWFEV